MPSTYVIGLCHSSLSYHRELSTNYLGFQFWLLGYEFPATLLLLTTEAMYVVTTAKKGDLSRTTKLYTSDR